MPVPVIGIVAKWTMNTANPIGSGAKTLKFWIYKPLISGFLISFVGFQISYRNMGVSGISLRIGGGKHSVNENEGSDDLGG